MERGQFETTATTGQEIETLELPGGAPITLREVGSPMIPLWPSYLKASDGVVFVVDLSQPEQVAAAGVELNRLLRSPDMRGTPCTVLLNKTDAMHRMTVGETAGLLALHELAEACAADGIAVTCAACSGVTGAGCDDVIGCVRRWSRAKRGEAGGGEDSRTAGGGDSASTAQV